MQTTLTKRCLVLSVLGALCWLGGGRFIRVQANQNGAVAARTGAPARGSFPAEQDCTSCHNGSVNAEDATVALAVTPALYQPNQEVQITLSVEQLGRLKFGFQGTALDAQGRKVGEWIVTDRERTKITEATSGTFAGRSYIGHTFNGAEPARPDVGIWRMRWKAPLQNAGRVTFFFAANAANNSGTSAGDAIYTTSQSIDFNSTLPTVSLVSAASFLLDRALAPDSIVALFGVNLANSSETATTLPLPTTLANVQVRIRDANDVEREAPLFFVAPGQINFLLPTNTANGPAQVTVRLQNTVIATGAITVAAVAPSLFGANADGQGVPAGLVFRVRSNGQQGYEPLMRFQETAKRFEPLPIELGAESDQVFLVLYGTGFRRRNSFACSVGSQSVEVLFAGAQGDLAGLDQVNLRLPRTLAGRGNVMLSCNANGQSANALTINIK